MYSHDGGTPASRPHALRRAQTVAAAAAEAEDVLHDLGNVVGRIPLLVLVLATLGGVHEPDEQILVYHELLPCTTDQAGPCLNATPQRIAAPVSRSKKCSFAGWSPSSTAVCASGANEVSTRPMSVTLCSRDSVWRSVSSAGSMSWATSS